MELDFIVLGTCSRHNLRYTDQFLVGYLYDTAYTVAYIVTHSGFGKSEFESDLSIENALQMLSYGMTLTLFLLARQFSA